MVLHVRGNEREDHGFYGTDSKQRGGIRHEKGRPRFEDGECRKEEHHRPGDDGLV